MIKTPPLFLENLQTIETLGKDRFTNRRKGFTIKSVRSIYTMARTRNNRNRSRRNLNGGKRKNKTRRNRKNRK